MRKGLTFFVLLLVALATAYYSYTPPNLNNGFGGLFSTHDETGAAAYLMARHAEREHDPEAAALYYYRLIESDAPSPSLAIVDDAIRNYLLANNLPLAQEISKRLLVRTPNHQRANLLLMLAAAREKNMDEAQNHFDALPQSPLKQFLVPHIALWRALAEETTPDLESLGDNTIFVHINLAQAAIAAEAMGEGDRAEIFYRRGMHARAYNYIFFTLAYGAFLERKGDVLGAIRLYREYQKTHAPHDLINVALARAQQNAAPPPLQQSPALVLTRIFAALGELIETNGHNELALIYGNIANALAQQSDDEVLKAWLAYSNGLRAARLSYWQEAYHSFMQTPRTSALYLSAQMRAAEMIERNGDIEAAIAAFSTLIKTLDTPADIIRANSALGDLYRRHERFGAAEIAYSHAIDALDGEKPNQWQLYFSRGITRERQGEWHLSEQDLQQARRLSRNNPYVLNYLGYSWVDRNEYLQEGLQILRQAVRAEPNNGAFLDSLGWAHYKLRRYDEALAFLERATEIEPTDPTITDHLGDVLWQLERHLEARFQWRKALAFSPAPELKTALEKKIRAGASPPPRPKTPPRIPRGGQQI